MTKRRWFSTNRIIDGYDTQVFEILFINRWELDWDLPLRRLVFQVAIDRC